MYPDLNSALDALRGAASDIFQRRGQSDAFNMFRWARRTFEKEKFMVDLKDQQPVTYNRWRDLIRDQMLEAIHNLPQPSR